nr:MAG TPA: hypothetical protein [Caudoviricetes sp.]
MIYGQGYTIPGHFCVYRGLLPNPQQILSGLTMFYCIYKIKALNLHI